MNITVNCKEINKTLHGHHLARLQDMLIIKVLQNTTNSTKFQLIEQINDINLKAKTLIENIMYIETDNYAIELIESILLQTNTDNNKLTETTSNQLTQWLHNIRIYAEISKFIKTPENLSEILWSSVIEISENEPEIILKQLVMAEKYDLTLCWLNIHPFGSKIQCRTENVIECFTDAMTKINLTDTKLFQLIEYSLPIERIQKFYTNSLATIRSIPILKYLLCYLMNNDSSDSNSRQKIYQKYEISVKIIEQLSYDEQNCLWNLIGMPLLIIEQYLMNTKFDTLSAILKEIRPLINNDKCDICYHNSQTFVSNSNSDPNFKTFLSSKTNENDAQQNGHLITNECIDSLLRMYATKALDFRISEMYSSTSLLYQSTEMISLDSLCGTFVMPKEPIVRSLWMPDNEASHCMCCRRAVFTMLARRHHCRQCGRVVCHACSTKRMHVPNLYADILVRVCNDCFKQTEVLKAKLLRAKNDSPLRSSSPAGQRNDRQTEDNLEWRFTGNIKHDAMLREEFGYEYAPSVSLCLSILTHHSLSVNYANFLLDHCRKFEALLRPIQPGRPNPEIDYALVTRMLNCLALAAKVSE